MSLTPLQSFYMIPGQETMHHIVRESCDLHLPVCVELGTSDSTRVGWGREGGSGVVVLCTMTCYPNLFLDSLENFQIIKFICDLLFYLFIYLCTENHQL